MSDIRVRFPPSPTGLLHVGNARTALFNYLFAKKYGGTLVFRFEDTDRARSKVEYEKDILDGLRWLGIEQDEGLEKGGPYEPYRQSERTDNYERYLRELLKDGKAFYCFHSEAELEEEGKRLLHEKKAPIHACVYRDLSLSEAEDRIKSGASDHIVRFKTPAGRQIAFTDLIRGELSFASDLIGDFSIARSLRDPLYHFAVVVDDCEMKISHVIRGEDHIANTPKHILLGEALGFPIPHYAHLPLILGPDRSKLSKRHGATSVIEYKEQGYLPEALFNFMALVGWSPGQDREILSREELISEFSLERVQKSGAIFDFQKLDWMNGEYIRTKATSELAMLCKSYLEKAGLLKNQESRIKNQAEYIEKVIALEQPRLKKLSEIAERVSYFFHTPDYDPELLRWKQMTPDATKAGLKRSEELLAKLAESVSRAELEGAFLDTIGAGDKGSILWPLRVALTGRKASPGPFEVMEILGVKESLARVRTAIEKLS
ncbi:MAG: glutamate--tRNA ligase [Candidatus Sungbacteria bacterium]|nr:glutamate--tRNA ligase [Candidatus Sungbacteria bacterium]